MIPYRLHHACQQLATRARTLRGMMHLDTHNPAGTVLLAGSGRSGTTWLSQLINHGNVYRELFEPFHPGRVSAIAHYPTMLYLRPDDPAERYAGAADALLTGRVRGQWTDSLNRKHLVTRRLIKDIRVNLMLGWVRKNYPQIKLIFAMRHPCAVAHSRLKLRWEPHLTELLEQEELVQDHLDPYRTTIESIASTGTPFEQHITMWCIENLVPLRQLGPTDAHVMIYENFCTDFDEEIDRLYRHLDRSVPHGIRDSAQKVSAHFRRDSAILRGGSLTGDWRRHLSEDQVATAVELLRHFGLDHLYGPGDLPLADANRILGHAQPHGRKEAA